MVAFGFATGTLAEIVAPSIYKNSDVSRPEIVRLVDTHPRVAASTARIAAARGAG
jgi:hypothetical protein